MGKRAFQTDIWTCLQLDGLGVPETAGKSGNAKKLPI